jgi:hypothetical protein
MKKLMTSIAAAAMLSTASFAADITMNSKGIGDYLVVPAYFANSAGWTSNVKVTNTDTLNCVVAKVVFREGVDSEEKLDFLLYLSPGDVWEGKLSYDGTSVKVTSTDDSTVFNGVMTSSENPLDKAFFNPATGDMSGYIEVFAVAEATGIEVSENAGWTAGTPVDKVKIYNAYTKGTDSKGNAIDWNDVEADLYAIETVDSVSNTLSTTVKAVAFNNFAETSRQAQVIAGQNTVLANTMTEKDTVEVLTQIDALLATGTAYMNFEGETAVNETALYLNTPTKKYWYNEVLNGDLSTKNYAKIVENPTKPSQWRYCYSLTTRDQMENTPTAPAPGEFSGTTPEVATPACLTREVDTIVISNDSTVQNYKNGVSYVNITNNMPVIPVAMSAVTVGSSTVTSAYTPMTK